MQALPYVVVRREGVAKVYEVRAWRFFPHARLLTAHTFVSCIGQLLKSEGERLVLSRPLRPDGTDRLRKYPQIETLEDNTAFCAFLREILDEQ
jgi:hypothetical protein